MGPTIKLKCWHHQGHHQGLLVGPPCPAGAGALLPWLPQSPFPIPPWEQVSVCDISEPQSSAPCIFAFDSCAKKHACDGVGCICCTLRGAEGTPPSMAAVGRVCAATVVPHCLHVAPLPATTWGQYSRATHLCMFVAAMGQGGSRILWLKIRNNWREESRGM